MLKLVIGNKNYSSWSMRPWLALRANNIPFEEIFVPLYTDQADKDRILGFSKAGKVPTLIDGDVTVWDSLAIIEYLDEIHPEPRLLPADPSERAYARSLAMILAADAHPLTVPRVRKHLAQAFGADAAAIETWCRHWTAEGLSTYERLLTRRPAASFALGPAPTIADISIAGQVALADVYRMELAAFPEVAALAKRCFALPAFAEAHPFQQRGYNPAG